MIETVVEVAAAPAMMEVMVFMEATPFMEVTGFGRRRGGGEAAGCDKRTEGEGGNSGLDRHLQSPSDLRAAVVAACQIVRSCSIQVLGSPRECGYNCNACHSNVSCLNGWPRFHQAPEAGRQVPNFSVLRPPNLRPNDSGTCESHSGILPRTSS
jgi:hypothetical protein